MSYDITPDESSNSSRTKFDEELTDEPASYLTREEKRHNAFITFLVGLGILLFGILLILVGQEGGIFLFFIGSLVFLSGLLFWLKYF